MTCLGCGNQLFPTDSSCQRCGAAAAASDNGIFLEAGPAADADESDMGRVAARAAFALLLLLRPRRVRAAAPAVPHRRRHQLRARARPAVPCRDPERQPGACCQRSWSAHRRRHAGPRRSTRSRAMSAPESPRSVPHSGFYAFLSVRSRPVGEPRTRLAGPPGVGAFFVVSDNVP